MRTVQGKGNKGCRSVEPTTRIQASCARPIACSRADSETTGFEAVDGQDALRPSSSRKRWRISPGKRNTGYRSVEPTTRIQASCARPIACSRADSETTGFEAVDGQDALRPSSSQKRWRNPPRIGARAPWLARGPLVLGTRVSPRDPSALKVWFSPTGIWGGCAWLHSHPVIVKSGRRPRKKEEPRRCGRGSRDEIS
jgi:hypothetical protein